MKNTVIVTSKCWRLDYWYFLSGAFERKIRELNFKFDDAVLMINNEVPEGVKFPCKTIKVDDYAKEALKFFNLTKDSFKGGYFYSVSELVEIYLAKDFDYLCHYSGDSVPTSGNWITEGIDILENDKSISVVSPKSDVNTWDKDGVDQFFSDQCYLIQIKEFRQPIYSYEGVIKEYPKHGHNSFEHMVAKYLRANDKFRRVLENHRYEHPTYG